MIFYGWPIRMPRGTRTGPNVVTCAGLEPGGYRFETQHNNHPIPATILFSNGEHKLPIPFANYKNNYCQPFTSGINNKLQTDQHG